MADLQDVMARALKRAQDTAPEDGTDLEERKAILMTGIVDAIGRGVQDEDRLTEAALEALNLYDGEAMDAEMREAPL